MLKRESAAGHPSYGQGSIMSARDRLSALLDQEPDAWTRCSLSEIAGVIGVSKQRVKQLMRERSKPRPRLGAAALLK